MEAKSFLEEPEAKNGRYCSRRGSGGKEKRFPEEFTIKRVELSRKISYNFLFFFTTSMVR